MTLIKKWKICLDRKRYKGAILLIRFDTINHEILIAKHHAYGFSKDFLGVILSYLLNHYLCVKVNSTFSSRTEFIQEVPQGSVLGPILFNVYLNDLFFLFNDIDIPNFADDTTTYVCNFNIETVLEKLEKIFSINSNLIRKKNHVKLKIKPH